MGTPARPAQHEMWERRAWLYGTRHLRSLTEHQQGAGLAYRIAVAAQEASLGGDEAFMEYRFNYEILQCQHVLTIA